MFTNRIQLDDEQTALRQVEKLGYGALDVRHIVVTRLDFDQRRHRRLPARDGARARQRVDGGQYRAPGLHRPATGTRPQQWDLDVVWRRHHADGGRLMGFDCVPELVGIPPEILMVPLPGHTWAIGVAVQQQGSWLLHAGDAYFFRGELDPAQRTGPQGLRRYHDGSGSPRAAWQPAAAARACRRAQRHCRRLLRPRSRRACPSSAALPARLWTACDERRRSSAGERLACLPPPTAGIARRMHKRTGVAVGSLEKPRRGADRRLFRKRASAGRRRGASPSCAIRIPPPFRHCAPACEWQLANRRPEPLSCRKCVLHRLQAPKGLRPG